METLELLMHIKTKYFIRKRSTVIDIKTQKISFSFDEMMKTDVIHLLEHREKNGEEFLWPVCAKYRASFFTTNLNSFIKQQKLHNIKFKSLPQAIHFGVEYENFEKLVDLQASLSKEFICDQCLMKFFKS